MPKEYLNIVDDDDNIIGVEERGVIHTKGLLHREVHVYFVTPNKEIIFQHRARDKDTFPDLLDATVGGHVEIGDTYLETAIKETLEETGVSVAPAELLLVTKIHNEFRDAVTNKINNALQQEFVYIFKGEISELKLERGKGLGFESWSLEKLLNLSEVEKQKFIPYICQFAVNNLLKFINK